MTPIDQTVYGDKKGNCFAACVASLLELQIEDVPNFCGDFPNERWWRELKKWLYKRKLDAFYFKFIEEWNIESLNFQDEFLWIASGKSPRGDFLHATVYCGNKLAHDPHHSREGLDGNPQDCVILVPFDVSTCVGVKNEIL